MCGIMFELYQNRRFPHSYFDISEVEKFRSCILQIIWYFNHLHQSKILDLNSLWNSDRMRVAFLTTLPSKFNIDSEPGATKTLLLLQTQFAPSLPSLHAVALWKALQLCSSSERYWRVKSPAGTDPDIVCRVQVWAQAGEERIRNSGREKREVGSFLLQNWEMFCEAKGTGAPQANSFFSSLVSHIPGLQARHYQDQSKAMAEKHTLAAVPQCSHGRC